MGDILLLFVFNNILLFVIIFWLLTWGAEFFFYKKNQKNKKQFYECGFKSISDLNIQFNLNFSLFCVFLILYDLEFIFLFPILFNNNFLSIISFFFFFFFFTFIIISLYLDIVDSGLYWQF